MITLTLTFDTPEQAHHVLEAYAEARSLGGSPSMPAFIPQPTGAAAMAAHVSNGVVHAQQQAANFAPNGLSPAPAATGQIGSLTSVPNGAPAAAPSTTTGASTGERDARGVIWHADHHSSSKKQSKGKWDRKRGHDKAAADAYEQTFAGTTTPASAPAAPQAAPSIPPAIGATPEQMVNLWSAACAAGKVFDTDQQFIEDTWKVSHPIGADALADSMKRSMIFAYVAQKMNP
jgi:hypothetical protein